MFWTRARSFSPRSTLSGNIDLFNRFFGQCNPGGPASAFPAFNVWANDEGASILSEIPGVKMEELEITTSGNTISIKGTRKEETGENQRHLRRERPEGEFNRTIELPFKIDAGRVEAKLANGVLRIELPRAENDKPRKIAINAE